MFQNGGVNLNWIEARSTGQVPNQAPDGTITAPATDVTITAGQTVSFAGGGSDPDGNTPLSYSWSFGAGSGVAASSEQNPGVKTFATAGVYTMSLVVTDALGLADPSPATLTVTVNAPQPPSVPTGLTLSGATQTTLEASCNVVGAATGYEWRWSLDQSTWQSAGSTSGASATLSGLPSDTLIYAQVRATNNTGASAWSSSASLTTLAGQGTLAREFSGASDQVDWGDIDTFDAVSKLTVSAWIRASDSAANDGAIITDWNNVAQDGWAIEFDYNSARLIFTVRNSADGYRYSYTSNWSWGVWHHVVCVYDGTLAAADRAKIYVDGSAATVVHVANGGNQYPPTSLTGNTQPLLFRNSRDDNTIDLAGVGIWAGVALTAQQVTDLYAAGGVATASGVTPSLYAQLGDTVEDETGTYTPTVTGTTVVEGPVGSPNQPPQSAITAPATDVTITAGQTVSFAGSGSDPDGNTPLSYTWDFGAGSGVAASSEQNPGVKTFATAGVYTVSLVVTDALGLADPSPATITVTVNAPQPPSVPTGLTLSGATQTTLDASCNAVGDATGYEWRWSLDQSTWQSAGSTSGAAVTLSGLPSDALIYAQVRATNNAGASAWSSSATATTNAVPDTSSPSVPTNLLGTNVTPTSFTVSWAASIDNVGVTGYRIFLGGQPIGTTTTTSYAVTGLAAVTHYSIAVSAYDAAGNESVPSAALDVVTGDPNAQSAYGSTAWAVPGTIEAEDYDVGGEGVAYHDTDATNEGGAYRSDGVDVEPCGEGGYKVSHFGAGEWLEYTIDVASMGGYAIDLRIAADGSHPSQTIQAFIDEASVGAISFGSTGGLEAFQLVTIDNVALAEGESVLRIRCDTGALNLNWIDVRPSTASSPIAALPYLADFEEAEGFAVGELSGQQGWLASQNVEVAQGDAAHGTRAAVLTANTGPAGAWLDSDAIASPQVVFIDFYARPTVTNPQEDSTRIEGSGFEIATSQNGASARTLVWFGDGAGGGDWMTSLFEFPLNASNQSADWVRFTIRADYASKRWDLYGGGVLSAIDISFRDQDVSALTRFSIAGPATGVVQFDSLLAGFDNPLFDDADRDGIDDAYESVNGMNVALNDRDGDIDSDGLTNIWEFMLGTRADLPDSDGDGMPDGWEVENGLTPLVAASALQDSDGDGLSDIDEYHLGTDPRNIDSDGDGMADGWEVSNATNPLLNDAAGDVDQDGFTNLSESLAGAGRNAGFGAGPGGLNLVLRLVDGGGSFNVTVNTATWKINIGGN